jgi:hypothetical protein
VQDQRARTLKARSLATLAATVMHLRHVLAALVTASGQSGRAPAGGGTGETSGNAGEGAVTAQEIVQQHANSQEQAAIERLRARAHGMSLLPGMPGHEESLHTASQVRHLVTVDFCCKQLPGACTACKT